MAYYGYGVPMWLSFLFNTVFYMAVFLLPIIVGLATKKYTMAEVRSVNRDGYYKTNLGLSIVCSLAAAAVQLFIAVVNFILILASAYGLLSLISGFFTLLNVAQFILLVAAFVLLFYRKPILGGRDGGDDTPYKAQGDDSRWDAPQQQPGPAPAPGSPYQAGGPLAPGEAPAAPNYFDQPPAAPAAPGAPQAAPPLFGEAPPVPAAPAYSDQPPAAPAAPGAPQAAPPLFGEAPPAPAAPAYSDQPPAAPAAPADFGVGAAAAGGNPNTAAMVDNHVAQAVAQQVQATYGKADPRAVGPFDYKCVAGPVGLRIGARDSMTKAVQSYGSIIASEAVGNWEFFMMKPIIVLEEPGCMGSLMGKTPTEVFYNMLIFRKHK